MSAYGVGIDTSCLICDRIENGENPYFVKELQTGYVVLGDHQHFNGYTLFLCKAHVSELYELDRDAKVKFLEEMSIVSKAVAKGFGTEKMNCELLGNGAGLWHRHIFPRRPGDLADCGNCEKGSV